MKFKELEFEDRKQIANSFCYYLLRFCNDYFVDEESLKNEISNLIRSEFFDEIVEKFETKYQIQEMSYICDVERFKLCKECNRPFISVDRSNKSSRCSYEPYLKYSSSGKKFEMKRSRCWVKGNREKANRYYRKQVAI